MDRIKVIDHGFHSSLHHRHVHEMRSSVPSPLFSIFFLGNERSEYWRREEAEEVWTSIRICRPVDTHRVEVWGPRQPGWEYNIAKHMGIRHYSLWFTGGKLHSLLGLHTINEIRNLVSSDRYWRGVMTVVMISQRWECASPMGWRLQRAAKFEV